MFQQHESVMQTRTKVELPGLYILKFICSLLVVQIHFRSCIRAELLPLTRIAVPCFFLITGYFLDLQSNDTIKTIKSSVYKVLRLFIFANLIYIVYAALDWIRFGTGVPSSYFQFSFWAELFLIGGNVAGPLWYLLALVQAYIIIALIVRCKGANYNLSIFIIAVGLIFGLLLGQYFFLLNMQPNPLQLSLSRNVFTTALPFILIGYYMRHSTIDLSTFILKFGAIISLMGLYIEDYLIDAINSNRIGDLLLFTIPLSIMCFKLFADVRTSNTIIKLAEWAGKYLATDIYIWHFLMGLILKHRVLYHFMDSATMDRYLAFLTMAITVIWAIVLHSFRRSKFTILPLSKNLPMLRNYLSIK